MRLLWREKLLWQVQIGGGHIYGGLLFSDTLRRTSRCRDEFAPLRIVAWKEKLSPEDRATNHSLGSQQVQWKSNIGPSVFSLFPSDEVKAFQH